MSAASADDEGLDHFLKQAAFTAHRTTSSLLLGLKQDTCTWRWFIHCATLSQFWNTTQPITSYVCCSLLKHNVCSHFITHGL